MNRGHLGRSDEWLVLTLPHAFKQFVPPWFTVSYRVQVRKVRLHLDLLSLDRTEDLCSHFGTVSDVCNAM